MSCSALASALEIRTVFRTQPTTTTGFEKSRSGSRAMVVNGIAYPIFFRSIGQRIIRVVLAFEATTETPRAGFLGFLHLFLGPAIALRLLHLAHSKGSSPRCRANRH